MWACAIVKVRICSLVESSWFSLSPLLSFCQLARVPISAVVRTTNENKRDATDWRTLPLTIKPTNSSSTTAESALSLPLYFPPNIMTYACATADVFKERGPKPWKWIYSLFFQFVIKNVPSDRYKSGCRLRASSFTAVLYLVNTSCLWYFWADKRSILSSDLLIF